MSIDMTNELKDLFKMYAKGVEHYRDKEERILPILVQYMKEYCETFEKRMDIAEKLRMLKEKVGLPEDEEGDE